MTPLEELSQLASEKRRRIFVAELPIDLRVSEGRNCVYVLELPVSALGAAGGRIGGIGERRIRKLHCFRFENGKWLRIFEIEDEEKLERFELPHHAAGLSVMLADGTERIVSGVVDPALVQSYNETV